METPPVETQTPEQQLQQVISDISNVGLTKLDFLIQKNLKFSPENSKVLTSFAVNLIVVGLKLVLKEIQTEKPTALQAAAAKG